MKLLGVFTVILIGATPAWAADWSPMTGAQIADALTGQTVVYSNARQTFLGSGRTEYTEDRPSTGYWRVEGDQYCSQWPPSDLWECYDMARDGDQIRFIARDGSKTDGTLQN
jgi:hypothetical protein